MVIFFGVSATISLWLLSQAPRVSCSSGGLVNFYPFWGQCVCQEGTGEGIHSIPDVIFYFIY